MTAQKLENNGPLIRSNRDAFYHSAEGDMSVPTAPINKSTADLPPVGIKAPHKLLGTIGGPIGLAYGIYYGMQQKFPTWKIAASAVVFGLAFHEIGEYIDRGIAKMKS